LTGNIVQSKIDKEKRVEVMTIECIVKWNQAKFNFIIWHESFNFKILERKQHVGPNTSFMSTN